MIRRDCESPPAKSMIRSAILYQNSTQDQYIIDIPTSIALAQCLPEHGDTLPEQILPSVLSCAPLEIPYAGPSPEPKSAKAMRKIMERIPAAELKYRQQIAALISVALRELRVNYTQDWCLPRGYFRKSAVQPSIQKESVLECDSKEFTALREPSLCLLDTQEEGCENASTWESEPPLILAPGLNIISTLGIISEVSVKNTSAVPSSLKVKNMLSTLSNEQMSSSDDQTIGSVTFTIPPRAAFTLTHISTFPTSSPSLLSLIPCEKRFHFIIMDPPWPNRSVHRSEHYKTSPSFSGLQALLGLILKQHLDPDTGIAAIWTTNSAKSRSAAREAFRKAGLHVFEEWVWIKTTTKGQPVTTLRGVWRQPFEVLLLARPAKENLTARRRIIAAVPDIHSRKPNLKELVEQIFFPSIDEIDGQSGRSKYEALEVFARNLTAGWWACGDEVLRFNWNGWWTNFAQI